MSDVVTNQSALMSFIERAAKDESFNVEKFSELLRLQRDAEHDRSRRLFNVAMAACQSQMEPVLRSSSNPAHRSKYAKLEAIDAAMRPVYTAHGFSVRFGSAPPPQPGWIRLTCTVAHEGGYFEENYLDSPVSTTGSQGGRMAMTPVQAVGSVVTYLRRYLLGMVFNIVQADVAGVDDDGEGGRDEPPSTTKSVKLNKAPLPPVTPDPLLEPDSRKWLVNVEMALADTYSQAEVEKVADHAAIKQAIALAPADIKRRLNELLANAYGRFAEGSKADDLPDVEIVNADKLAAG